MALRTNEKSTNVSTPAIEICRNASGNRTLPSSSAFVKLSLFAWIALVKSYVEILN